MPSRRRWWVFAAALVGLLVAAALVVALSLRVDLPAPTGPHAVGRASLFAHDGERPVVATLYYPARPAADASVSPYVTGPLAEPLLAHMGALRFFPDPWSRIGTHAYDDAPAAPGRFPVLLFSPGLGSQPEFYATLLTDLASHGYVVAALAHVGSTPLVALEDGALVVGTSDLPPPGPSRAEEVERRGDLWTRDLLAALDAVGRDPRVESAADVSRVGAIGHSFGGATAVEAAARDARILAAIDMDGTLFGVAQREGVAKPILLIEDDPPSDETLARLGLTREGLDASPDAVGRRGLLENASVGYRMRLHGANHATFETDTTIFAARLPFVGGQGEIDGDRAVALLRTYALAFFDRHVKGEGGDALDGPHPPEVSFASA